MNTPRPLRLVSAFEQVLPGGKRVTHKPWTLLIPVLLPPKRDELERTLLTFQVDDLHPLLELTTGQVSPFPRIITITENFGSYLRFDTFDVDFSQPHPQGFVIATDRLKNILALPINIIEGVAGHAYELAQNAS